MHLVVYAGPPKTGSSTVQEAIWRNRESLRAAGIEYVWTEDHDHWNEWSLVSLYAWPAALERLERFATPQAQRRWSASAWTDFEARLDQSTADVVLISSEHFYAVRDKAELVGRLQQRAERVSFITYARDPVSLYPSFIDEAVRGGTVFSRLPDPSGFSYPMKTIRAYAPLLSKGGLVVRSFQPKDLVGGDIVTDFFDVLSGLTGRPVQYETPVPRQNQSLCGAATLWLLSSNALNSSPSDGEALKRRLQLIEALHRDEALRDLPKLRITDPAITMAIRINNRTTLNWLNAGPLAHSPLETAPADAEALPGPQLREKLRRWLFSYGHEDHMKLVMGVAMREDRETSG